MTPIRASSRRGGGAACILAAVVLAGCGGDEEPAAEPPRAGTTDEGPGGTSTEPPAAAPEEPEATTESPATATAPPSDGPRTGGQTAPEEGEGGAGDEEPIRSEAVFTGRRGRISPRTVRVPPFIAVRLVLRSADGESYRLTLGSETVSAGPGAAEGSIELDGLQPGGQYVAVDLDRSERVRVIASAEPGP